MVLQSLRISARTYPLLQQCSCASHRVQSVPCLFRRRHAIVRTRAPCFWADGRAWRRAPLDLMGNGRNSTCQAKRRKSLCFSPMERWWKVSSVELTKSVSRSFILIWLGYGDMWCGECEAASGIGGKRSRGRQRKKLLDWLSTESTQQSSINGTCYSA